MNETLETMRKEINALDETIKQALKRRFELSESIGKYKQKHNMPVLDASREKEILDAIDDTSIRNIYAVILRESKARQTSE